MLSMRYIIYFIIVGLTLTQPFVSLAKEYPDSEVDFFDFEKYNYTYLYFYNFQHLDLRGAGLAARRTKRLAQDFVKGFDAVRKGRTGEAVLQFQRASRLLPEYFHIDFIIALTYEEKGDIKNAARFYKSYLEKLKRFRGGRYRLTQPLIENTVNFKISGYEEAKELVDQRMAKQGIDMQRVSSGRYPMSFIFIILAAIAGAILYALKTAGPVKRIIYKIKAGLNHSEDFWVCQNCGRNNGNINITCYGCGKAGTKR